MPDGFAFRILVVDDEQTILTTSSAILGSKGYEVRTAKDGFAGLAELRRSLPDLIISDLRMPNMSGFELLSIVRRRFPQIPVIAISGEFNGIAPEGLIADAFFTKGLYTPEQMFQKIAELLEQSPIRPHISKPDKAPVWIPKDEAGYIVITCTQCLRSFSIPAEETHSEVHEAHCIFCDSKIRYLADFKERRKGPRKTG